MGVITEREKQKYFAYLDGVADGLNESRNDVNSVLNKISAEIDEHIKYNKRMNHMGIVGGLVLAKDVLDKYKAESEEV